MYKVLAEKNGKLHETKEVIALLSVLLLPPLIHLELRGGW